ncbi:MAG: hypothetical protein WC529_07235 [Candidatus Margulisiibacteriota bacterium]
MKKLIYFSRFLPTIDRGGGCHRMMQMLTALSGFEVELVSAPRGDWLPENKLRHNAREVAVNVQSALARLSPAVDWGPDLNKMAIRFRSIAGQWADKLTAAKAPALVIIDDPIYFLPLYDRVKKLGLPVIAFCQNIESLSFVHPNVKSARALLQQELETLAGCDEVVLLAQEEDWLLRNLGQKPILFPYYPVQPLVDRLMAVRQARSGGAKNDVLLMGTANNLPTRLGISEALAFWGGACRERLLVAGYNTGRYFENKTFPDNVRLLGELTNQQHDELLARVKAVLCYQLSGSGALTRICEMLIAGVPVVANRHAARSYHRLDGVHEFDTLADLPKLLAGLPEQGEESAPPQPPDPGPLRAAIAKYL